VARLKIHIPILQGSLIVLVPILLSGCPGIQRDVSWYDDDVTPHPLVSDHKLLEASFVGRRVFDNDQFRVDGSSRKMLGRDTDRFVGMNVSYDFTPRLHLGIKWILGDGSR